MKKNTFWGEISINSDDGKYFVSGNYEGIDFYGEFWEDDDGLVNNLSFDKPPEDNNEAVSAIEVELNKYRYGEG